MLLLPHSLMAFWDHFKPTSLKLHLFMCWFFSLNIFFQKYSQLIISLRLFRLHKSSGTINWKLTLLPCILRLLRQKTAISDPAAVCLGFFFTYSPQLLLFIIIVLNAGSETDFKWAFSLWSPVPSVVWHVKYTLLSTDGGKTFYHQTTKWARTCEEC